MSSIQWLQLPFALVTPGQVLAAGIVLPLVCIACVGLRFYVRRLQKTSPGVDDWLIAVGVVFIAGMGACLIIGERLGVAGYPTPVPDGTDASEASGLFLEAYIEFALQFIQVFAYGFVKAGVICFCRRIFVGHKNSAFDWASKVLIAMVVLWSVGFWMALVVGCGKSVELHWAPLQVLVEAGCDASTPEEAMVISDLILDLFILILPLPAIWKLNMSVGRKYAVTGIFLFGIMSIAASAARVAIYLTVLYQGYSAGYDINRTSSTMLWWSMLEVSLAGIAACLPTFSFLVKDAGVRKHFQRLGSITSFLGSFRIWRTTNASSEKPSELPLDSLYITSSPGRLHSSESQQKMVAVYQGTHEANMDRHDSLV
ncbi:putative Integral membrane protein [Seiridium cardinale]|uniref:Integral membrane protein n=1 Tax=Seiridium cardinale TaxID=138064 RepID=A0ABR2XDL2_9PEZI